MIGEIIALLKTFFGFGKATAEAVTARTKPVEIQIADHKEQKELREQDFSQEMINDDFAYLKRRTEIDIENYLQYLHPNMENIEGYVKIVTARVHQYRYDRPVIYKKWIHENPPKSKLKPTI